MQTCWEKRSYWPGVDYRSIMHTVLSDGLRVGIKSFMATVRGPGLKYRGVSSQQGLRTTGGLDLREVLQ